MLPSATSTSSNGCYFCSLRRGIHHGLDVLPLHPRTLEAIRVKEAAEEVGLQHLADFHIGVHEHHPISRSVGAGVEHVYFVLDY